MITITQENLQGYDYDEDFVIIQTVDEIIQIDFRVAERIARIVNNREE